MTGIRISRRLLDLEVEYTSALFIIEIIQILRNNKLRLPKSNYLVKVII